MTIFAFLLACPMAWWAIWYDFDRDEEWPLALKWTFILSVLLVFAVAMALDYRAFSAVTQ